MLKFYLESVKIIKNVSRIILVNDVLYVEMFLWYCYGFEKLFLFSFMLKIDVCKNIFMVKYIEILRIKEGIKNVIMLYILELFYCFWIFLYVYKSFNCKVIV